MGRREFYLWVDQANVEQDAQTASDPDSWRGVDNDAWWQEVRRKREEAMSR